MSYLSAQLTEGIAPALPLRVLVLDDDRFDRKRVMRWAKSASDYPVEIVESADLRQFETALKSARFDLVVVDYYLADGDGLDALDHLVASAQNFSAFVVMISGVNDPEAASVAKHRGCDRYVPKSEMSAERWRDLVAQAHGARAGAVKDQSMSVTGYWATRAVRRSGARVANSPAEPKGQTTPELVEIAPVLSDWMHVSSGDISITAPVQSEEDPLVLFLLDFQKVDSFDFVFDRRDF